MIKLTDLQICQNIAKIEELNQVEIRGKVFASHGFSCDRLYNPLMDDALCFQLQNQYEVCVHYGCGDVFICGGDNFDGCLSVKSFDVDDKKTLNKAICLAIIEAHKGLLS